MARVLEGADEPPPASATAARRVLRRERHPRRHARAGSVHIVARSLGQGRRSGLAAVAGVALGNLGNAIGASAGLAALFAISSAAFTVIKYAGAVSLVSLGVHALRSKSETERATPEPARLRRIFRDGLVVALLNPKTAVFFAAFLAQFMGAGASVLRSVALGALFVAIAAVTDTVYAVAAGTMAPLLSRARGIGAIGRWLTGGTFIGLGLLTAFSGQRTGK